jgi:hypothetical protein
VPLAGQLWRRRVSAFSFGEKSVFLKAKDLECGRRKAAKRYK